VLDLAPVVIPDNAHPFLRNVQGLYFSIAAADDPLIRQVTFGSCGPPRARITLALSGGGVSILFDPQLN
jgi:hypothetical protein